MVEASAAACVLSAAAVSWASVPDSWVSAGADEAGVPLPAEQAVIDNTSINAVAVEYNFLFIAFPPYFKKYIC